MPDINQLSRASSISPGDLIPIFSTNNGDARAAAVSLLVEYIQGLITSPGAFETQYYAPAATGFSVTIAPTTTGGNVYLLLTPVDDYAAGTITLPAQTSSVDGQEVLVSSTHAVTTLTIGTNGATAVNGAPTTLAANDFFKLRYDGVNKSWYRIG